MYRKCQYLHFCSELSRLQVCFQANFTFKWKVHVPGSQLTLTSEHSGTRVKTREALAERQMYGWKNIKAAHNPPSACVCVRVCGGGINSTRPGLKTLDYTSSTQKQENAPGFVPSPAFTRQRRIRAVAWLACTTRLFLKPRAETSVWTKPEGVRGCKALTPSSDLSLHITGVTAFKHLHLYVSAVIL